MKGNCEGDFVLADISNHDGQESSDPVIVTTLNNTWIKTDRVSRYRGKPIARDPRASKKTRWRSVDDGSTTNDTQGRKTKSCWRESRRDSKTLLFDEPISLLDANSYCYPGSAPGSLARRSRPTGREASPSCILPSTADLSRRLMIAPSFIFIVVHQLRSPSLVRINLSCRFEGGSTHDPS